MVFKLCSSDPQDSPWAGYLGEQKGSWNDKGSITSHPPFISTRETSLLTVLRIRVLPKSSLIKGFHCKQNILKPFSSNIVIYSFCMFCNGQTTSELSSTLDITFWEEHLQNGVHLQKDDSGWERYIYWRWQSCLSWKPEDVGRMINIFKYLKGYPVEEGFILLCLALKNWTETTGQKNSEEILTYKKQLLNM